MCGDVKCDGTECEGLEFDDAVCDGAESEGPKYEDAECLCLEFDVTECGGAVMVLSVKV